MSKTAENFIHNFRMLRDKSGLTQHQLAEELNIAHRTVQGYEHGTRFPKPENLDAIAAYFGLTTPELLSDRRVAPAPATSLAPVFQTLANHPRLPELLSQVDEEYLESIEAMLESRIKRNLERTSNQANRA